MKQNARLIAALGLLVTLLAVAMATNDKMNPVQLAVKLATENKTEPGPLSPEEGDQRRNSSNLIPENGTEAAGSNSSVTAGERGHIHFRRSSPANEKLAVEPLVSNDETDEVQSGTTSEEKPPKIAASPYQPQQDRGSGRLLVAVARTLVVTTASTSTVGVFLTCHVGPTYPSVACTGKRKRRKIRMRYGSEGSGTELEGYSTHHLSVTELDGSQQGEAVELVVEDEPLERTARLILWSSITTTVVFLSTTTTGGPVSASFGCSIPGLGLC